MEVARAWLDVTSPSFPPEVTAALATENAFGQVTSWIAEPEARVRFDQLAGEPRNSDLVVWATDCFGAFVMSVEAKADESFGETVNAAAAAAEKRRIGNPRSRGTERLTELCRALLGATLSEEPSLGTLRYQLLTATAGAIAAAMHVRADRAILLLHEFRSAHTKRFKHEANAAALNSFIERITKGATSRLAPGRLYEIPIVPGTPLFGTPPSLFIAKVVRSLNV